MKEGGRSVYRIAVLAEQEAERQRYAEQMRRNDYGDYAYAVGKH